MLSPSVGVIIFNESRDKVLLVRHKKESLNLPGKVGLPAGQIRNRNTVDVALEKLGQETGITVPRKNLIKLPFKYSAWIDRSDGTKKHFSLVTYLGTEWHGTLLETGEDAPFWAAITGIDTLDLLPNVHKAIYDALDFKLPS